MNIFLIVAIAAVAAAAVATVIIAVVSNRRKTARRIQQIRDYEVRSRNAIWAVAVVVQAAGGISGEGATRTRMSVTLEVTPPGKPPYRATTCWLVDITALGSLQPGSELQVKIDINDSRIVYPGSGWASFAP